MTERLLKDGDGYLLQGKTLAETQGHNPKTHNHSGESLLPNEVLLPNGFKIIDDGKHGIAIQSPSGVLYTLAVKEG